MLNLVYELLFHDATFAISSEKSLNIVNLPHLPLRASVDWNALRDHVSNQFLNIDETQSLRDELENVRQSAHEPIPQYLRRFRETADVAYPPPSRTPDHQVIMIRAFARGLLSDIIARKLVEDIIPTDLDTAMQAVARLNERADTYSRLKRYEEPMEISMLNPLQVTPSSPHDGLQKQMEKLSTKLAKIEASTRSNQANWHGNRQTFNNNGRRVDTRRVDTRVNRANTPPPPPPPPRPH